MAQLLKHPFDCVRICNACGRLAEARYNGAQILPLEDGSLAECRLYTCQHPACGSTYSADPEPRPDATEDDVMRVTDRRNWAQLRAARVRGMVGTTTVQGVAPPAPKSAPGPTSRGVLPEGAGRYSLVVGRIAS